LDEFFATGEAQVAHWLQRAADAGLTVPRGHAVDFGCGIGRLTQALGRRFEHVTGIDISETMVAIARRVNAVPGRVAYVHNLRDDLSCLPDACADAVISHITLQHMKRQQSERYLQEFFRVSRRGALICFQLPSHLTEEYLPADAPHEPLPLEASRAALVCEEAPAELPGGARGRVRARVTNASRQPWVQSLAYPIQLANRWLTADGRGVVVHDDGRARLPGRLEPGQSALLALEVRAPAQAGDYRIQLDVVQESVRWFQDVGSAVAQVPCQVVPADAAPANTYSFAGLIADQYQPTAAFEMHGVPRSRVEELIRSAGARLVCTDSHVTEWVSYGYYVER
jgi:SAM-dependent methyltransferase